MDVGIWEEEMPFGSKDFLFFFIISHVREEKEEEEHDGRIKKNKGYTTTRLCWWVTKRKELKSFLKFKRPALFIFWKIIARKGLADGNVFVYNIKISIITGIMELQRDKEINRRRKSALLVHSFDCRPTYMNRMEEDRRPVWAGLPDRSTQVVISLNQIYSQTIFGLLFSYFFSRVSVGCFTIRTGFNYPLLTHERKDFATLFTNLQDVVIQPG